jgi:hypothetical protein
MEIDLPLWIVHPKESSGRVAPAQEPCDSPDHSLAFSDTRSLTRYLEAREEGKWQVHHVRKPDDLIELLADLNQFGIPGLCLDPKPDGTNGKRFELGDLAMHFERRRRKR